jgi:hypothetical protein
MTVIGIDQQILIDLKEVIKKHKLSVFESDNYGGEDENYEGCDHYFMVDGDIVWTKTIGEILKGLSEEL